MSDVTKKGAYNTSRDLTAKDVGQDACRYQPDRDCPPGQYLHFIARQIARIPKRKREEFLRKIETPIDELLSDAHESEP